MGSFKHSLQQIGQAAAKAGLFVGRQVASGVATGYRSIDPDVIRHLAHVPLLSYSLFVSRREDIVAGEPDGHCPLVFVHGLGGNRGNFLPMALFLRMYGRKRSYKIHFDAGQSIEEMAEALAAFIDDVLVATSEEQVELVAHSLGGIVSRLALEQTGLKGRVKTLITLGSPLGGTYPARYANTETTRQLRPDSELVQRLKQLPWPKAVRGVSFWSRNDLFVLPAESAAVPGTEQIELTPFTHYSYLVDPRAWTAVAGALSADLH